jgi:hypothetical protein
MKIFITFLLLVTSTLAFAQDPETYFNLFDNRVYSLKTKGIKDFSVDVVSSKLTQEINSAGTFGKVKELHFRVYWTVSPERLDIEVMGMPEGFKEFKEELKIKILNLMDNILPLPLAKKFAGYKASSSGPKQYLFQDTTGINDVPSYTVKFDDQDKLIDINGNKPIGTLKITPTYEKDSFTDGKWALKKQVTSLIEGGQEIMTIKTVQYGKEQGFAVVKSVSMTTEQKFSNPKLKPASQNETIEFKNYKLNANEATNYFQRDKAVD